MAPFACAHPCTVPVPRCSPCRRSFAPSPRRTRRKVEAELVEAAHHRDDATRHLDFDAYQNLTEQIDDLLAELHTLRG